MNKDLSSESSASAYIVIFNFFEYSNLIMLICQNVSMISVDFTKKGKKKKSNVHDHMADRQSYWIATEHSGPFKE